MSDTDTTNDSNFFTLGDDIGVVMESYRKHLLVKRPTHEGQFAKRMETDPEAATAEAIIFAYLRSLRLNPSVAESLDKGGADFHCRSDGGREVIVEATSLKPESISKASGLPAESLDDFQPFSLITGLLKGKATTKARQLSGYPMPRLLAIASSHIAAHFLIGRLGARRLLTGDTRISVPIGSSPSPTREVAPLANSVFFHFDEEGKAVVPCRRSISAILLIAMGADESAIVGLLHPDPSHRLDVSSFPGVPFLRIKTWPISAGRIETEWIVSQPNPARWHHTRVRLTDSELREV